MTRTSSPLSAPRRTVLFAGLVVALATAAFAPRPTRAGEAAVKIAPPAVVTTTNASGTQTAVFAGGCFWGVQGVFQHVQGVANAVSGYAGGDKRTAVYEIVGSGLTGHAESVAVTYDPRQVSYAKLLQIHFSVAHDPTQLNRQGPDSGTQYRSAVFPQSDEQARVARAYIAQLDKAKVFGRPIATKVEPGRAFYPAEDYHQDYLVRHPSQPYIAINDLPKVADLKRLFPDAWRAEPALVADARKRGAAS